MPLRSLARFENPPRTSPLAGPRTGPLAGCLIALALWGLAPSLALAQALRPPDPEAEIPLRNADQVIARKSVLQGDRMVRFEMLAPSQTRKTSVPRRSFLKLPPPLKIAPEPPLKSFVVSSTVYDGTNTQLTVTSTGPERETLICWSNLNWQHLQGIHQFDSRWGHFSFLHFSQSDSLSRLIKLQELGQDVAIPEVPELLTPFQKSGARYYVTEGENESALDFLEAIHELYDENKQALRKAHRKRLKEREQHRKLLLNPPPKPDVIIRFRRVESINKRHSGLKRHLEPKRHLGLKRHLEPKRKGGFSK